MKLELVDGVPMTNIVFAALVFHGIENPDDAAVASCSQDRIAGYRVVGPSAGVETFIGLKKRRHKHMFIFT